MALRESGYTILMVREYLEYPENHNRKTAVIRHDVDRKILNALRMAELEQTFGIHATYYFRYPYTFRPEILTAIRDMGHEIGYHYETLSKVKGDLKKAIALFESELISFRRIFEIKTICVHGSPLSKHDSLDLWKTNDFRKFDIRGDAFLSMEGTTYFTDTGRNWSGKHSLRDKMPAGTGMPNMPSIVTTDDLIKYIQAGDRYPLYLTIHPERWALNTGEWVAWALADGLMNAGKDLIQMIRT